MPFDNCARSLVLDCLPLMLPRQLTPILLANIHLCRAASLQPQQRRLFSVNGLKQAAQELRQSFHSLWQRASMEGMRCTGAMGGTPQAASKPSCARSWLHVVLCSC